MTTKDRARKAGGELYGEWEAADAASEVWIEQINDCIQKRIEEVSGWNVSLTRDQRVDIMDWLVKLRNEIVTGSP